MTYRSVFAPGLFDGQTIIVTGGGSGIGRCTAHELARLGAHVVLVGRTQSKLDAVAAEIEEDGGQASSYSCDIREEDQVIAVVDGVLADRARIDGLVNNAGGQYRAELKTITTKGFETVVRGNLIGGFIFMREVYNRWMEANGGSIVNMIADIWHGWPHFSHSAASRGGMHTLTESAATEWAVSGTRINTVAPGCIASSGLDTYDVKDREYLQNKIACELPFQRFGNEAEVSAAIVFLLSPAASYITGSCIRIDGGGPGAKRYWWELEPTDKNPPYDGFHRAMGPAVLEGDS